MANSKEKIAEFVRNNLDHQPDPDAMPRMHRMLYIDRSITNINIKDSTFFGRTALHYQAYCGTTGSVAWLLRQDPPPDIDVRDNDLWTPLMSAVWSKEDPEGKVRLLLDHGAKNRDFKDECDKYFYKPAAVMDMLENYRPDVSR